MENKNFNEWAIIELFGHQKIAGKITEQTIGGCSFVRVDVPKTKKGPAFTRMFGQGAIYSITITDQESAKIAAEIYTPEPMEKWTVASHLKLIEAASQDEELSFDD